MEWIGGIWDTVTDIGSDDKAVNVVPRDLDGGVIGGSDAPSHTVIVDENGPLLTEDNPGNVVLRGNDGSITDLSNIELILPTPQKADFITAIGTDGGSVAQTGILKANLYNSGNTTIYVWFGEAPAEGKRIILRPGMPWNESVDNKSGLYYDSDAAGGQLDYVLLG